MVVWSSVFVNNIFKVNAVRHLFSKSGNGLTTKGFSGLNYVPARYSGHNTFPLRDSSYNYFKLKDFMNFYLLLAAVPLGAIIFYINIFIGPAKLALVPEGYVPKYWEYYEHPISRCLKKYFFGSDQEYYERQLHTIFVEQEKYMIKQLEFKVKELIKERHDYQAWYYHDVPNKYNKIIKESLDDLELNRRRQNAV